MSYYSFVATAKQPVGFTQPLLMLDAGVNVFSIVVDDVDSLLDRFKEEGVTVQQMNRLDVSEPSKPEDILLEGENLQLGGAVDGVES